MTLLGYLQINRICNNNCIFCSNPENGRSLSFKSVKKSLLKLKSDGYTDVMFTGGEPTLHKSLFKFIRFANYINLRPRIITNGLLLEDFNYLKSLKKEGISIVHFSFYTYKKNINNYLRNSKNSHERQIKALYNLSNLKVTTQVTIVISKETQDDLYKTLLFLKKINPNITHFVFNVLDPLMIDKSVNNFKSIPNINLITDELLKCFNFLTNINNTFRIERVPLCKIPGYEWANTECRKIVKNEPRRTLFLDEREDFIDEGIDFQHEFGKKCINCTLRNICGGVYEKNIYYNDVNLIASNKDPETIKKIILNNKNDDE